MTRTRESSTRIARAVPQTLSDNSIVWNVELFDNSSRVAIIGVVGGAVQARALADKIDQCAAWAAAE